MEIKRFDEKRGSCDKTEIWLKEEKKKKRRRKKKNNRSESKSMQTNVKEGWD